MKLSIITINYNNCESLNKTIDSVISQKWQNFEWIVVDGGSTDGSRGLIEQTASLLVTRGWTTAKFSGSEDSLSLIENSSIIDTPLSTHRFLWCSEKDKGIYNAMNKGILHAKGEYCLFLNSGDYLNDTHSLETVFKWGLTSDFECFDMIEDRCKGIRYINKLNYSDFHAHQLIYDALPHQASFIRRDLFRTVGMYDENLKIASDWKFEVLALVFNSASFSYRPFVFSRTQPNGISRTNFSLVRAERNMVLQSLFPRLVLKDYVMFRSYVIIHESSCICRLLYRFLFRLARWILKHKK